MTIEQLQYFIMITKTKSFSNAALELNISQSALSKQIARLENELGIKLFDRTHRQIELTTSAKSLYQDIQAIIDQYNQFDQHLQKEKILVTNTINIATLSIYANQEISLKIKRFQELHPNIKINIHEVEMLIPSPKYDFYFTRFPDYNFPNYDKLRLYQDKLVALVSTQHHFAKKKHLSINDLKEEKLFFPPHHSSLNIFLKNIFKQHDIEPNVFRYSRIESVIASLPAHQAIALTMNSPLQIFHLSNIKVIDFNPPIYGDVYLCWQVNSKKASMKSLITFLEDNS